MERRSWKARVPLDVDLEDRLIYGLSPLRFAYVVVAGLAAFGCWSSGGGGWVRAALASCLAVAGASFAWGGWRGRPLDRWTLDIAIYLRSNYRLRVRDHPGDVIMRAGRGAAGLPNALLVCWVRSAAPIRRHMWTTFGPRVASRVGSRLPWRS